MKRPLFILIALAMFAVMLSSESKADFNGERWNPITGMGWRMGSGCPDYVLDVAQEIMAKAPFPITYNGLLPVPSAMQNDGQSIIYCSEDLPPQAVEIPDPDITSDQAFTIAGQTRWWYVTSTQLIKEADIWLRLSTLNEQTVYRFLWHEIYHAWGLQHDQDARALMYYAPTANEPFIYDLAEISRLYEVCENIADKQANLFVAGVDMTDWINDQPQIVRDLYSDFAGKEVSFVQEYATVYPDMVKRARLSGCD